MGTDQSVILRLQDLLREPRETLDVELKGWLDVANNGEHEAILAKAIIALANHGGGFVIIGLEESPDSVTRPQDRPRNLYAYNTDAINSIISRYH